MTNVWTAVASPNVSSFTHPCGCGSGWNDAIIFQAAIAPEIFNGVSWITQSGTNAREAIYSGGAGTTSSVLQFGGYGDYPYTDLWDGTTWIVKADMPYGLSVVGGCGSTTDALAEGHALYGGVGLKCHTYNGVSWTTKATSGAGTAYRSLFGSTTSALQIESGRLATRLWNGSAWSAGGTRLSSVGGGGAGDDSSGVAFGQTTCQEWSGTTWIGGSNLLVSISIRAGGTGNESLALAFASTACKYDTQVLAAPVANFSGTPTSGLAPLTVVFTDLSTNTPTTWDWDWGDGSTHGTTMNPTHIFTIVGNWTVTLTASNAYGSDSEVKVAYIGVTGSSGAVQVGDRVVLVENDGKIVVVRL